MAVTVSARRNHTSATGRILTNYDTLTLSGTYATGGFSLNPSKINGGVGTAPSPVGSVVGFAFFSPTGFIYTLVGQGAAAVVKIFSAPGTELANGTAVPDTTLTARIDYLLYS